METNNVRIQEGQLELTLEYATYDELINIIGNEQDYSVEIISQAREKLQSMVDFNEEKVQEDIAKVKRERKIVDKSKKESFSGWLIFFMVTIVFTGIVSILGIGIVLGLLLFSFSIYTVVSFVRRKENAVYLGRTFVTMFIVINLFVVLIGGLSNNYLIDNIVYSIGRSIVFGIVWLFYLSMSDNVDTIYPPKYRRFFKIDYYIIAAISILILISFGVSCITLFGS